MRALALFSFVLIGITLGVVSGQPPAEASPVIAGLSMVSALFVGWLVASFTSKVAMLVTGEGSALLGGFSVALLVLFLGAFVTVGVQNAMGRPPTPHSMHGSELLLIGLTFIVWAVADMVSFISDAA